MRQRRPLPAFSTALTCSLLSVFSLAIPLSIGHAQQVNAINTPRTDWKQTYQRFAFDLKERPKAVVSAGTQNVTVTLSSGALTPSKSTVQVPGDQIQVTVAARSVTFRSVNNRPIRVNSTWLRKATGGVLVLDVYPQSTWLDYTAPNGVACPFNAGGTAVPFQAPAFATGSLGFYMARIDPKTLAPITYVANQPDQLFPLASTFKQATLWQVLRDVDNGRLKFTDRIQVTDSNRSIEAYKPGNRTVQDLTEQMIWESENTASDIMQMAVGPDRMQASMRAFGACNTTVRITTKAWWAAQGGLLPDVFGPSINDGAKAYFTSSDAAQAKTAARAVASSLRLSPDTVYDDLDRYFYSPAYDPQLEVFLQNRSTPREWAGLLAKIYVQHGLSPASANTYRRIMDGGCCKKKDESFRYWGTKAGSGWRLVTMSGFLQHNDGSMYVYAYLNVGSDVIDSDVIEGQLPLIARYIWETSQRLAP